MQYRRPAWAAAVPSGREQVQDRLAVLGPRSPASDHWPQVRGVSHDTRALTESAARSSGRDTAAGSGRTPAHRNSLVKAAASPFQG